MSSFWTDPENFEFPRSKTLTGKLRGNANMFFESKESVNRDQIVEMCNHLLFYPDLRFIKFDMPNLRASFSSTYEAEDHLNRLVGRK